MVKLLTWIFCAGGFLITLRLIFTCGLLKGGRPAWLVVLLLLPSWMSFQAGGVRFDARSLCAIAYLIGVLRQDYRHESGGWYLSDLAILLNVVAITISQFAWRSVAPLAPFDPFRDMVLPYLVGRFFIVSARDIESILPTFCRCIAVLVILAAIEAVTQKNPLERVLGGRVWAGEGSVGGEELDSLRWGLKRAYCLQTHPIGMGLTFAMLLPWALEATVQSWHGRGPRWWRAVPLLTLVGVVCTGSRAAQICFLIVMGTFLFQVQRRLRPLLLLMVAFGGIGFVAFRADIVQWLQSYAAEGGASDTTKINGLTYEYSGTKHRDLLFIVYEEAIENAGWLGYGTLIKQIPRDPDMDDRFKSIDNHYLMYYLQYGWLGLITFSLFAFSALWNLLPPMLNATGPPGRLAGGLFGAIGGCLIAFNSVWFNPDYAWVWLFSAGLTVGLSRCHRDPRLSGAIPLA
jgi:O-Antigen ligase